MNAVLIQIYQISVIFWTYPCLICCQDSQQTAHDYVKEALQRKTPEQSTQVREAGRCVLWGGRQNGGTGRVDIFSHSEQEPSLTISAIFWQQSKILRRVHQHSSGTDAKGAPAQLSLSSS